MERPFLSHTHCTLHPVCVWERRRERGRWRSPTHCGVSPTPYFCRKHTRRHTGSRSTCRTNRTTRDFIEARVLLSNAEIWANCTAPPPTQQKQTRIARSNTACISNRDSCKAVILHACLLGHQLPPLLITLGMDVGLRVDASFCIALTHLPAIMLILCVFGASAPEQTSDKKTVINRRLLQANIY